MMQAVNWPTLLSTAQVCLAAVVTGRYEIADRNFAWVSQLLEQQPADAGSRLFTFRRHGQLLLNPNPSLAWAAVTNFATPRQSYYTAGMAAVFLASYSASRGVATNAIARTLLQRNIEGCEAQFNDPGSVQICKFGWGAAVVCALDPASDLLPHVARMGDWSIEHQAADGAWAPSTFLSERLGIIENMVKTTEHVVEINAILDALGVARGRGAGL